MWWISHREIRSFTKRPLLLFVMVVAPLSFLGFFASLMGAGLPTKLPAAVVDEDNSVVSRTLVRTLGSMQSTKIVAHYPTFSRAREAVQRGHIYGFFYIPKYTTEEAIEGKQPMVSFYTNDAYYVPASLLMKDMRKLSEMSGIAITRATLQARGMSNDAIMGLLQPITVESHPMGNPYLNYSVVLTTLLVPGIIFLMIMLTTCYSLGNEWKRGRQKMLYKRSGKNVWVAITGKLLPQAIVYTLVLWAVNAFLFGWLHFPHKSSISFMFFLSFLTVLASQGFSTAVYALFPGRMRFSMSVSSLLGVMSLSLTGFSFPVNAMTPPFQIFSNIFPLRHYFLIYISHVLNGYALVYVWPHFVILLAFFLLPLLFTSRMRNAFLYKEYKP